MSDVGSEDGEDQGPDLGVSTESISLSLSLSRHMKVKETKLVSAMVKEKLSYQTGTVIKESMPMEREMDRQASG